MPIEDSVGALADMLKKGHIRGIGLSEVSSVTLTKAHALHPIAAVQTEYSLWTRNPEIAILHACQKLGVAFVAFSRLGRGLLCGAPIDIATLDANDIRRSMPRFLSENFVSNQKLLSAYNALAREAGCSPSQLALAWLLHKAPHIIPIPGTTSLAHLHDDLGAPSVVLSSQTVNQLDGLINQQSVQGARYNAQAAAEVDTETF